MLMVIIFGLQNKRDNFNFFQFTKQKGQLRIYNRGIQLWTYRYRRK